MARLKFGTSETTRSGLRIYPMLRQEADRSPVIESNHPVHELHALRRAERPALRQHRVVDVFQANAR